jgi:hypothetical protein
VTFKGVALKPPMGARVKAGGVRGKWLSGLLIAFVLMMVTANNAAMADAFGPVHYDPKKDQIIVTMIYDGTNPHHQFTIQWGRCHKLHDRLQGPARKIINVGILDKQGNDAARKRYTKIVKVPLAGLSCKPATVTLWTPPNQYTSIVIP